MSLVLVEVAPAAGEGRLRVRWGEAVSWEARSGTAGGEWQVRAAPARRGEGPSGWEGLSGWAGIPLGAGRLLIGSLEGPVPARRSASGPFRVPGDAGRVRPGFRGARRGVAWRSGSGPVEWTLGGVRRADGATAPEGRLRIRAWQAAWDARGAGHVGWRSSWRGRAAGAEIRRDAGTTELRAGIAEAGAAVLLLLERGPEGVWSPALLAGIGARDGPAAGLRVIWEWRRDRPSRTGWRAEWNRRRGGWDLTFRTRSDAGTGVDVGARRALGTGLLLRAALRPAPGAPGESSLAFGLRRTRSSLRGGAELELDAAGRAADAWAAFRPARGPQLRLAVRVREGRAPEWDLAADLPLGARAPVRSSR